MWEIRHRERMLQMAIQYAFIAKLKMVSILAIPAEGGANGHWYLVPAILFALTNGKSSNRGEPGPLRAKVASLCSVVHLLS